MACVAANYDSSSTWFVSASNFMLTFSIEKNEVKGTKLQQTDRQTDRGERNKTAERLTRKKLP
jgi:hypothetical protein